MARLRSLLFFSSLALLGGCINAHTTSNLKTVDWKKECASKCTDASNVILYSPDNRVTNYRIALYSMDPLTGCLCEELPKTP